MLYELTWPGKEEALAAASSPVAGVLSDELDLARNVFVRGDNLEVLKLLQPACAGRVRVIYIDPPYNTGKNFVYRDGRQDHARWLSMMYPRLVLARSLLAADGVLFISIDDNELAPLRMICDEIFGEENFIENYVWESNFRPDNSSSLVRENCQYVMCFARSRKQVGRLVGAQRRTLGMPSLTKASMPISVLRFEPASVDLLVPDGSYGPGDRGSGYSLLDPVVVADGRAQSSFRLSGRVIWSQAYLDEQVAAGTRIVIKGTGFVPYSKKLRTAPLPPTSLIPREEVGDVLAANAELRAIFGDVPFTHPKPTSLIRYLVASVTHDDPSALVLDFFAGSGSTAHGVAALNHEDGGTRRAISVNLPEPVPTGSIAATMGFATVADITEARLRWVTKTYPGAAALGLDCLTLTPASATSGSASALSLPRSSAAPVT